MPVATARQGELYIAAGAAVALHGVLFALLVLLTLVEIIIDSKREKEEPKPPEPEVVVELDAQYLLGLRNDLAGPEGGAEAGLPPLAEVESELMPVPAPEPPQPEPEPKAERFERTIEAQASEEAPENTNLIGDNQTVAGSEIDPVEGAPATPNQEGDEKRKYEATEHFDSKFQEGEDNGAAPSDAERLAGEPDAEDGTGDGGETKPEMPEQEASGLARDAIVDNASDAAVEVDGGAAPRTKEESLREQEAQSAAEAARKGEHGTAEKRAEDDPRPSGFRTESRKTRSLGSLSNQGRSSLDVDKTVKGQWYAKASRAIETEWRKQCLTYRNHIRPGSLTLRFYIDKGGNILNPQYTYQVETSSIQKGFTLNAVRRARIPAMPRELVKELDGEPEPCIMTFNFIF